MSGTYWALKATFKASRTLLEQLIHSVGMPGTAVVDWIYDGETMSFVNAARAHIAETRCGYDSGSFELKEIPPHRTEKQTLHGNAREVALIGGKLDGFRVSIGYYGEVQVNLYLHDHGADVCDERKAAVIAVLKNSDSFGLEWDEWLECCDEDEAD